MSDDLAVPDAAVRYILFQRTAYLRLPVTTLYRHIFRFLPFETPLYNMAVSIESRLWPSRAKAMYIIDMHKEYQSFKDFLPTTCSTVLDIGCGVAGVDVFLHRHYGGRQVDFYLLDKSRTESSVFYLFNPRGASYNSLDVSRALLTSNGVPSECIHLLEATDNNEVNVDIKIDVVVSLLSWGFHYPVATYVEQVSSLLSDEGIAILDVRKGTDGVEVLRRTFQYVDRIFETEKFYRLVARKPLA